MATITRLIGRNKNYSYNFNSSASFSSNLRRHVSLKYDLVNGRQAALFVNRKRNFQTNSQIKAEFNFNNVLEKKLRGIQKSIPGHLLQETKSFFHDPICSFSLGKRVYAFSPPGSSNEEGGGSNNKKTEEKVELPGDDPEKSPHNQLIRIIAIAALITASLFGAQTSVPETSWPSFLRLMLQTGEVEQIHVSSGKDKIYIFLANGAIINGREVFGPGPHYYFTIGDLKSFEEKMNEAQEQLGVKSSNFIPIRYSPPDSGIMSSLLSVAITLGILGILFFSISGGIKGGMAGRANPFSSHTRAKALVILPGTRKGIGFKNVAGMQEAKQEVKEFVDYLKYPERFKELGAKIPRGALLCGPPGTGKTLLAKAVSTEAAVPFLSMAGSDFVEMYSGVGSARVRDLFAQARKHAPCIVYIDEVDAIGRARRSSAASGGNSEQENTLNQLLVEMDGMNTVEGIIMLASTNRADVLDKALLRPGRFDRNITIDLPTLIEREEIFKIYLKQLKLGKNLGHCAKRLAELTPGKSGADISNICNEAALHAARLNEKYVEEGNFEYAIERVIAGIQKNNSSLSPEERNIVAYHEAGHVLVSWMLKHTEPVLKVSIVPRTNSPLGYMQKFPLDLKLHTNEQLLDMMCSLLGGRLAEAVVFNKITTGAEDDLQRVTDMAYKQIMLYGMNQRIGPISFSPKNKGELSHKPYSDKLSHEFDKEVNIMVTKANRISEKILQENRDKLDLLAAALLENEVLNYDNIINLIGQSPYGDKMKNYYAIRADDKSNIDDIPQPSI